MTTQLEQFIIKYHGLPIDFDGQYQNQCVDLYRQYVAEVLHFPQSPGVGGAKEIYTAYPTWPIKLRNLYQRIANTPNNIPTTGDIVVWGSSFGVYGHVAIYVFGDVWKFISFDQNMPLGTVCHMQHHNYNAVLGWLHPIAVAA